MKECWLNYLEWFCHDFVDERFTVPTEEAKVCLDVTKKFIKLFVDVLASEESAVYCLSNWLIDAL